MWGWWKFGNSKRALFSTPVKLKNNLVKNPKCFWKYVSIPAASQAKRGKGGNRRTLI